MREHGKISVFLYCVQVYIMPSLELLSNIPQMQIRKSDDTLFLWCSVPPLRCNSNNIGTTFWELAVTEHTFHQDTVMAASVYSSGWYSASCQHCLLQGRVESPDWTPPSIPHQTTTVGKHAYDSPLTFLKCYIPSLVLITMAVRDWLHYTPVGPLLNS